MTFKFTRDVFTHMAKSVWTPSVHKVRQVNFESRTCDIVVLNTELSAKDSSI